jgi:hypothetical protein
MAEQREPTLATACPSPAIAHQQNTVEIDGHMFHLASNPDGRARNGCCQVCGWPEEEGGWVCCSYPHAMVPDQEMSPGMWSWKFPEP